MKLLKSLSSIIALTSCAVAMFLIRRKKFKFFTFVKTLDEKKNNSRDESKLKYCEIPEIPELPNPNWVRVGQVKYLHMYPLSTGKRMECPTLTFTKHGIIMERKGFILWDRMFRIYDEQIKQFLTEQDYERLKVEGFMMNVDVMNKSKMRFSAPRMFDLTIDLDKETGGTRKILSELKTNWILIRYIDCGDIAANWLNTCLQSSTLRLMRAEYDIIDETTIDEDLLKKEPDAEASELLTALTRYTVITSDSWREVRFETVERILKVRPNIVISATWSPPYAEKNWEWMKMGNIIMRNIMPTLSLQSIPNDDLNQPSFSGVFCEFYNFGDLNVTNDVFVHVEDYSKDWDDSPNDIRNAKN